MKNNMNYTPGPWVVTGDKKAVMVNGLFIAEVGEQYGREANAILISAAPELLEALESARDSMAEQGYGVMPANTYGGKLFAKITGAIAKAKGESK